MSKKYWILVIISLALVLTILLYQGICIRKLSSLCGRLSEENDEFAEYLHYNTDSFFNEEEAMVIDEIINDLNDSTIVAYIPMNLCRSCVTSMLMSMNEIGIEMTNVTVYLPEYDYSIANEIKSYGARCVLSSNQSDSITDIIIIKKSSHNWAPLIMKYMGDFNNVLHHFLT